MYLNVLKRSAKSKKLISFPCVIDPDLRLLVFNSSSMIGSLKDKESKYEYCIAMCHLAINEVNVSVGGTASERRCSFGELTGLDEKVFEIS